MNISREEKKKKAIEIMELLDIYSPYIRAFEEKDVVTFFEGFGGYYLTESEKELYDKVREFEKECNGVVYAIIHNRVDGDECYSFLYVPDYENDWEYLCEAVSADEANNEYYVASYVWNKSYDWDSEFGDIGVRSFGGGIKRFC